MDWNHESVIVFGGGGFLGSALIKRLNELGCKHIRSFARSRQQEAKDFGVEVVSADIRDKNAVLHACEGMTMVFHTAAKAGVWGKFEEYREINVDGTKNVLEACESKKVNRLIYTSSPSVAYPPTMNIEYIDETYPFPANYLAAYPETKAEAEKMLAEYNSPDLKIVALRPHLIWGPGDRHLLPRIIERAKNGKLKIVGDGSNIVDLTYIDNAVEAHIKAAAAISRPDSQAAGKAYFISDDNPVNLWDWLSELLGRLGINKPHRYISYKKAFIIGSILEKIYSHLPIKSDPPMTRFVAGQLAFSHYFNISAAKDDLKYSPVITQERAIAATVEYLQNSSPHE